MEDVDHQLEEGLVLQGTAAPLEAGVAAVKLIARPRVNLNVQDLQESLPMDAVEPLQEDPNVLQGNAVPKEVGVETLTLIALLPVHLNVSQVLLCLSLEDLLGLCRPMDAVVHLLEELSAPLARAALLEDGVEILILIALALALLNAKELLVQTEKSNFLFPTSLRETTTKWMDELATFNAILLPTLCLQNSF
jgi:hypothetical protein